jgi:hypothetical protein
MKFPLKNESLPARKKVAEDKLKVKDATAQRNGLTPVRTTALTGISDLSEGVLDPTTGQDGGIQERRVETGHIKIMKPGSFRLWRGTCRFGF